MAQPTLAELKAFQTDIQPYLQRTSTDVALRNLGNLPGTNNAENAAVVTYPSEYLRKSKVEDALEREARTIKHFTAPVAEGGVGLVDKPRIQDVSVDHLNALQKIKEKQQFDQLVDKWIEAQFDLTQPANVEYVMKRFPDYFKRKSDAIDKITGIVADYAKYRLLDGHIPEGDSRVMKIALAEALGMVDHDKITDLIKWLLPGLGPRLETERDLIQRGMFSPFLYPGVSRVHVIGDPLRTAALGALPNMGVPVAHGNMDWLGRNAQGGFQPQNVVDYGQYY